MKSECNYVVAGDFHENGDALHAILMDNRKNKIVLLGDYFDSKGGDPVFMAHVMKMLNLGNFNLSHEPILIRGNHDQMILDTIDGTVIDMELWLQNGGNRTLRKLGFKGSKTHYNVVEFLKETIPDAIELMHKSEVRVRKDGFLFVHGGLDLKLKDPYRETPDGDVMWLRDYYYFYYGTKDPLVNNTGRTIVSGHTPTQEYGWDGRVMPLINEDDVYGCHRYVIDGGSNSGHPTGHVNAVEFDEVGGIEEVTEYPGGPYA